MKKIEIGSRVTISTHGSNLGTVLEFYKDSIGNDYDSYIVQMDGEPGPRLCLVTNVFLNEEI